MKNEKDIEIELRQIAPILASQPRINNGSVPINYFELSAQNILKRIQTQELLEIAPTLAKQVKPKYIKIPENYFNSFPTQVLTLIRADLRSQKTAPSAWLENLNKSIEDVVAVLFRPSYSLTIAGFTSVALLATMLFTNLEQRCGDLDCKMAQLSNEEIDSFLASEQGSYSDEVFELYDDTDLLPDNISSEVKSTVNGMPDQKFSDNLKN